MLLSLSMDAIIRAKTVVALTGAGISTESGIPDYRGPGGVWESNSPPTLGDYRSSLETRTAYWQSRVERYPTLAATQPNDGHRALAALAQNGHIQAVITQNIDGLHQKAGHSPDQVVELHGNAHMIRCFDCNNVLPAARIQVRLERGEADPACESCGGVLRAATVLFGEPLPPLALHQAIDWARRCDLMLVIGTSLLVKPAAQLPVLAKQHGAKLVILNRTPTPLDRLADVRLLGEAGPLLQQIASRMSRQPV